MSNRFKFRVWDKQESRFIEWYNADPHIRCASGAVFCYERTQKKDGSYGPDDVNNIREVSGRLILQQFTGLKDKNGKEIYEGDILFSHVNEKPCNYIVKWADDRSEYCGFVLNPVMKNPPRVTFHIHDFGRWMAEGFEVIGNIFENPELLAEKSLDESQIL